MPHGPDGRPVPMRVASRADGDGLVAGLLAVQADLRALLEAETAHVRAGRFREGLSQEVRKSALAAAYMQGLEAVKGNAVALARLAPEALQRLKAATADFAPVVEANHLVLATARAVSETLLKGIADEMGRQARPQGYAPGPARATRPATAEPLLVSRSL